MKISLNRYQRGILFSIMDSSGNSISEVLAQAFGLLAEQQEQQQLQKEKLNANNQEREALPLLQY